MKMKGIIFVLVLSTLLTCTAYCQEKQATKSRLAEIVKAAEKEGMVSLTSNWRDDEASLLIKAFNKEYPNIKMTHEREHGLEAMERLLRELVSGNVEVNDVVHIVTDYEGEFLDLNVLESENWAEFNVVPQTISGNNRLVAPGIAVHGITYNTKLIKKEEAPKTHQDLLDPKWKGKVVVDTDPISFMGLASVWGAEKVLDYAKNLGKNNPIFMRGQSLTANMITAGDNMLAMGQLISSYYPMAKKGGPIAWNLPDPLPVEWNKYAVLKKAKHPNAGKLLLIWLATEGFKVLNDINPYRSIPFRGTFLEKEVKGKTLAWIISREQMPNRQEFRSQVINALGVPKGGLKN